MKAVLPRSVTLKEGDWVTLNEQLADLRTAVERLVSARSASSVSSTRLGADDTSIEVTLPAGSEFDVNLYGRMTATGLVAFEFGTENATSTWCYWSVEGTTFTRATGTSASECRIGSVLAGNFRVRANIVTIRTGVHVYGEMFKGSIRRSPFVGDNPGGLGRSIRATGAFEAGTVLTVKAVR